ncbi:hypothetical protein N7516_002016 [Penicillium verrucosum]|uniref:uncharacterized protein n=1 Tax=Penicillium verrucosum TaxID=60171 RepID=UPI00254508D3|nr:uncharacterized protein N7516_002016 [Penicillium verrucosum]KAJ5941848.1 hypothetical protein N7516_002016 [Penicillium verrucosum]
MPHGLLQEEEPLVKGNFTEKGLVDKLVPLVTLPWNPVTHAESSDHGVSCPLLESPDWSNRLILSTVPGVIGPRDLLLLISQAQDITVLLLRTPQLYFQLSSKISCGIFKL